MTKYRQNVSFEAITPGKNICQSKRPTGPVLNISENLKFKDQRPSSPHYHIWAKLQFWSHNSTQMYWGAIFVNVKDLFRQCYAFLKI